MSEAADQHSLAEGRTFPWHEVYAPDAQATIDFYTSVFDMGSQSMDMGSMTYHMLSVDGKTVAGVLSTKELPMPDVPPHWAVYLSVDDVDARLAKATAAGAHIVVPAMDVPTVGRMALIADPQGAHIWLYKSESM